MRGTRWGHDSDMSISSAIRPACLSLVIPVYNEQESILPFLKAVREVRPAIVERMGGEVIVECVFINDGSADATADVIRILARDDRSIKLVNLSRNFGKEAALAAGLNHATGDAVIPIDVDLQDPPELICEMVGHWIAGAKVVNAKRADRSHDSLFKRVSARLFYLLINKIADNPIPSDVGDFRLIDRQALDVINKFSEQSRFNKGLFSWVGFEVATVEYCRPIRSAGHSKWGIRRLWRLALDAVTSSTTLPLRIWSYLGGTIALLAFAYALFLVVHTMISGVDTPGYASIMVTVLILGGLNLLSMGIIGEYLGRIAVEVRGRPLYVVDSVEGF